jgi:tetratricopeptide (TPR) repeat protein
MDAILEMYDLIKKLISRRNPVHNQLKDEKTATGRLMSGILAEQFESDKQAAKIIHTESESDAKRIASYRKTKYQLVNRLVSTLFSLNICNRTYSEYLVNAYSAKKELVATEMLLWFQSHKAMRLLVGRILKKARYYHLTREKLRCLEILRYHATLVGTQEDCLAYTQQVEVALKELNAEIRSANIKTVVRAQLTEQISFSPESLDELLKKANELEGMAKQFELRTIWLNCATCSGLVYRHAGQFDRALVLYERCFEFFHSNSHLTTGSKVSQICFYAVRCCMILRNFDRASQFAEEGLKHQEIGSSNWFSHISLHSLLACHKGDWRVASEFFCWAVQHPKFHKEVYRIELWSIIEGYLRFFAGKSEWLPLNITVHGQQFQLHHLLEEITEGRQDKAGLNIAILIFQVLHRLKERQFDLLESRIKALNNYLYKYLRKDNTGRFYRTETLIHMFATMLNCRYEAKLTQTKTSAEFQQLLGHQQPDTVGGQQIEEIVPYEHIWERVLQELQQIETDGVLVRPYATSNSTSTVQVLE